MLEPSEKVRSWRKKRLLVLKRLRRSRSLRLLLPVKHQRKRERSIRIMNVKTD